MPHARILNVNTHVGQSLRYWSKSAAMRKKRGTRYLVEKYEPDFVTLQEVQRPLARWRMRRVFPRHQWSCLGNLPPAVGLGGNGAMVLGRRKTTTRVEKTNRPLTAQRFVNGKRDKWHPTRRIVTGVFVMKNQGDRKIAVASDHAWSNMGMSLRLNHIVPNTHKHQIVQFAGNGKEYIDKGYAVARAGDYNEDLDPTDVDLFCERVFESAKFKNTNLHRSVRRILDAVWLSRNGVSFSNYTRIPNHEADTDHPAIVVDIEF